MLADNYYNTVDSSYTITVTDDKGCTASVTTDTLQTFVETMDADTILISQYYSGTTDANEVSCFGYNDGEVLLVFGEDMDLILMLGQELILLISLQIRLLYLIYMQEFIR